MDKGAHFYRCDFQVHTPRDPQWSGDGSITDTERQAYAAAFISACREKGLNGIAITDHHDMAFVPHIREAAKNERDEDGQPVPRQKQIVIFPAMELTLAVPCQAIVIFDAEFPDDLFSLAMNALAITQNPTADEHCRQAERLNVNTLLGVCEKLDDHQYLRGRYILLPNVSEKGTSTLLRSGHATHYREMPCVGAYLDGSCDQHGKGNSDIVAGRNAEYGSKKVALFQTSDNRRRDFADLGTHSTWVKWATPTAEALRQACLAQESRISQDVPSLPSVHISSIEVSNSLFMGPINLEFNRQYNAIIGGRGTGKSTILEYLRWGVCDQPPAADDLEGGDFQNKRKALVTKTLTALNSVVQVKFSVNGVAHTARRNSQNQELTLKIGDGDFTACSEADVRSLLPIQAYSQKQLSNVGVRVDELDRLIRMPVRQQLSDLENQIKQVAADLRTLHVSIQKIRAAQKQIEKDELETQSLEQQAQGLRAGLTGFSVEDQKLITLKPVYDREDDFVQGWVRDIERLQNVLTEPVKIAVSGPQTSTQPEDDLPDVQTLREMGLAVESIYGEVGELLTQAVARLRRSEQTDDPFQSRFLQLNKLHEHFKSRYEAAKARSTSHEAQIKQLGQLEVRIKELRKTLAMKRSALSDATDASAKFRERRQEWMRVHRQRAQLLSRQCTELTKFSNGQIRATLREGVGTRETEERLKSLFAGLNLRGTKIEKLLDNVVTSEVPLAEWESVLSELESLAECDPSDPTTGAMPPSSKLSDAGFTETEVTKICTRLKPDTWVELSLVPLSDHPKFEYRTREDQYIPFTDASAGQQATALLFTLLNQDGPPLIVDQPEDDLDNQVVLKVVEQIWKAKQKRQLLFSSHNANLVVNGDAELVVCCDYRVAADQSGGVVKNEGAIDIDAIRNEITTVMEGGQQAFKLRKEKYGF